MSPGDQQSFDFPAGENEPRRKRYRRRHPGAKPPPVAEDRPLTQAPVTRTCGFCGHRQTVLGDSALCDECEGIVSRHEASDD